MRRQLIQLWHLPMLRLALQAPPLFGKTQIGPRTPAIPRPQSRLCLLAYLVEVDPPHLVRLANQARGCPSLVLNLHQHVPLLQQVVGGVLVIF